MRDSSDELSPGDLEMIAARARREHLSLAFRTHEHRAFRGHTGLRSCRHVDGRAAAHGDIYAEKQLVTFQLPVAVDGPTQGAGAAAGRSEVADDFGADDHARKA